MDTQKILVVTPCHNRIFDSTLKAIFNQNISSNVQFDLFCPYLGYSTDTPHQNITEKYNQARDIVLKNGYTAMWCVESDMHILPDTFEQMYQTAITGGWSIVYGLYVFRREPFGLNDYIALNNDDLEMYGYPLSSVLPDVYRQKLKDKSVVQTDGLGLGNTLIMRDALTVSPFLIDWNRPHGAGTTNEHFSHCDWYTALEWQKRGVKSAIHYGVRTGHHTAIGGNACTLWPCAYGLVPDTHFRALPYGGFDMSEETRVSQGWIDDNALIQRFQECLCTPTDMLYNLQWLSYVANGVVVELGTRYGISTTAFMVADAVKKVYTFDIETDFAAQFFKHDTRFSMHVGDSTDNSNTALLGGQEIDLLFVDTKHTTEQVLAEMDVWFSHVKPGGLIVFHDAQISAVQKAVDIFFDRHYPTHVSEYWYPCGQVQNGNPYPVIAMRKV